MLRDEGWAHFRSESFVPMEMIVKVVGHLISGGPFRDSSGRQDSSAGLAIEIGPKSFYIRDVQVLLNPVVELDEISVLKEARTK